MHNARVQNILDPKWQLFVKVADAGSVSGAALALDMQQSVVSRHITRLEQESGTRLFRRTGRGVVLTEFGQQVYPRVMALIRFCRSRFLATDSSIEEASVPPASSQASTTLSWASIRR